MALSFEELFDDLTHHIEDHGIPVFLATMEAEKPGEFNGVSITINRITSLEARCYYLAHSFGSIVQWSTNFAYANQVFEGIRNAKPGKDVHPDRFEEALEAYREFEATSSEHAVWLLEIIGHQEAVRPYTVFFRADIEAMTIFHKTGEAPAWPEFFGEWKRKVDAGELTIEPFDPKPYARFPPMPIEQQEVLQKRD